MRSIMVSSPGFYSGKSAITMALAMKLKDNGYKVGYMKPCQPISICIEQGLNYLFADVNREIGFNL